MAWWHRFNCPHTYCSFCFSFIVIFFSSFAAADRPTTNVYYDSLSQEKFDRIEILVRWDTVPKEEEAYLYAGFGFNFTQTQTNNLAPANGYMGLQKDGKRKKAIFSIWDLAWQSGEAQVAPNSYSSCKRISHEGSAVSCIITYHWKAREHYLLRTALISTHGRDQIWGAWVIKRGRRTLIGKILLHGLNTANTSPTTGNKAAKTIPQTNSIAGYGLLQAKSNSFLEYYVGDGMQDICTQPYARVTFSSLFTYNTANNTSTPSDYHASYLPFSNLVGQKCLNENVISEKKYSVSHEVGGKTSHQNKERFLLW